MDLITAIKASITPTKGNTIVFRPVNQYGFIELYAENLNKAFQEILDKIPSVQAGIDEFTETEKLMLEFFKAHAEWHGYLPTPK